jgi:phosphoserine phosphatase
LRLIAARENVSLARCAFVGDHLNDLAAARAAGLAIAFNPKSPELEAAAQVVLRGPDLRVILEHL